jgi:hypothetical protein
LHAGDVDEDEFVYEDAEVHEGKEVHEVGAVSCSEVGPTALEKSFFSCQYGFTLREYSKTMFSLLW